MGARRCLVLVGLVWSMASCTPAPVTQTLGGCEFASDCGASEQCLRGRCVSNTPSARCTSDTECGATERCSALYGECVEGARACTGELDCSASGLHCQIAKGICAQCNINEHCGPTSVCIDGMCADPLTSQCMLDDECLPPRTVCTGGRCVAGCTEDSCGLGKACDSTTGRCTLQQNACMLDTDCAPPVTVCETNGCVPGCVEPGGECGGAEICNTTTGRCDPPPSSCRSDAECGAPAQVCVGGQCTAGCLATGCLTDQTCNPTTGRCDATQPPLLPLDATCARDGDCLSDVCFDFGAVGRRCVESCGSAADCPAGFTCHAYDGARMCMNATLFSGSTTFTAAAGAQCSEDGECHSGLCENQRCVDRCTVDGDCSGAMCNWYESSRDTFTQACNGPNGNRSVGQTCNTTDDCETGVCIVGGNTSTARCLALCDNTDNCGNGTVCASIDYSFCTNGSFTNCDKWRVQGVKACVEDNHGNGAFGSSCSRELDCRSLLCNPNLNECTDTCSTNADCPSSYRCKVDIYFEFEEGSSFRPYYFNVCLPET